MLKERNQRAGQHSASCLSDTGLSVDPLLIPGKQRQREPIGHKRGGSSVLDNSPGLLSKSLSSLFLTQVLAPVAEKLTVFGMCLMTPPLVAPMGVITGGAWNSPRAGTPLEKSSHRSFQFCVSLRDPNPCLPRVSIFQSSISER